MINEKCSNIITGIIREYAYLEYINEIRKLEDEGNFKFYFLEYAMIFKGWIKQHGIHTWI